MEEYDIYVRVYNQKDGSLQFKGTSVEFPEVNTINALYQALYWVYGKNRKIQILRKNDEGNYSIVTNVSSKINKYLFKDTNNRHYVTIQFTEEKLEDLKKSYFVTYISPSIDFSSKIESVSLSQDSNYHDVQSAISGVLNNSIKFFGFSIPTDSMVLNTQTTNQKQMIPLRFTGTLKQFESTHGNIIKIQCGVVTQLKIYFDSEYTLQVGVHETIRQILEKLSSTELTLSEESFNVYMKQGQQEEEAIENNRQIFSIYKGKPFIILYLRRNKSYEFLAFDEPLEVSLRNPINEEFIMNFVSYYKKDQLFIRLIKSQIEKFSIQWRKLTIDCFKRGFDGTIPMNLLQFQKILSGELQDFTLWNKLEKTFINVYLIERSNSFGKILLAEMLRDNFPLPSHVIFGAQRKSHIIQENIFITSPGVTLASIEFSSKENKGKCHGKTTLLNDLFYMDFLVNDQRHQSLASIPFIGHQIFKDDFAFNVIDIPKGIDPLEEEKLLRGANIILLNSWESENLSIKKAEQLSKIFNCHVLIIYRDRKEISTKFNFDYDSKNQNRNTIQIFNLAEKKKPNLPMNTVRTEIGKFIFEVSKRMKEQDRNKIYKIYQGTKYYKKFMDYVSIINNIKSNITTMKTSKGQPIHPLFQQILKFILENQDFEDQKKFAYIFISALKKMKAYAERPYLDMYYVKSSLEGVVEYYKKKQNQGQYGPFINKTNEDLRKIFKFSQSQQMVKKTLTVEENLSIVKEQITKVEKSIVPNIFSSEIAMRQLLIGKELQLLDKERNLKDVYTFLNTMQIKRGAPFQIIDGDNLDMPLDNIKKSLNFVKGKVFVVSVVGPQSSGKSTVLNFLFGCNFRASEGRCTKGIYGSYYEINPQENIVGYNGILIIDTEGINSQSKDREFDRQLVSFIMSISDVMIITMKGDLDKSVADLLILCYQNSLKRFSTIKNMKSVLVLNQNNTDDISKNNKEINNFKDKMKTTYQTQLARAFKILVVNNNNLPFLHKQKNFNRLTPMDSFMGQIIKLQFHIIQLMNLSNSSNSFTMDHKMEMFSKNWEIVRSFSRIYSYDTNQQIHLATRMDQWIVTSTNQFEQKQHELIQVARKKLKVISHVQNDEKIEREKLRSEWQQKMLALSKEIMIEFSQEFKGKENEKQLQLTEFIKKKLTPRYDQILQGYATIFKSKLAIVEQEQIVINVEEQGLVTITSKAYEIRNKQILDNKQMSPEKIKEEFQKIWDQSLKNIKRQLDTKSGLSVITELVKEEYNLQKMKLSQQDEAIKDLPKVITSITQKNIQNKNQIYQIFKNLLQEKKKNLLERSSKDPIFIYDNNAGIVTAEKKYLNIQKTYLKIATLQNSIGVEKQGLGRIFSEEMITNLKYEGLLMKINKELESFGIEVKSSKNLKQVVTYEPNILKSLGSSIGLSVAPLLELEFTPTTVVNNQKTSLILTQQISSIKSAKNTKIDGKRLLNISKITEHMKAQKENSFVEQFLNKELNLVNLKFQFKADPNSKPKYEVILINRIQFGSFEAFKKQIQKMPTLGFKIELLLKYGQVVSPVSHHIVGKYRITKHIVDPQKHFPKQLVDYFTIYVSEDNKKKIQTVKEESINVVSHIDFITPILDQIKKEAESILNKPLNKQKAINDLVYLISNQFKIFDEDYRQLSLKSTQIFKGYCHLYATYLLVSTRMIKQSKENEQIIKKYSKLKDSQQKQFQNRASTSQEVSSLAAFKSFKEQILASFTAYILNKQSVGLSNFKSSYLHSSHVQSLKLNIEDIMKQARSTIGNPADMIQYITNKYSKLEQVKNNMLIQRINNYGGINKILSDFNLDITNYRSAIVKLEEACSNLRITIEKQNQNYYDEKNFFTGNNSNQKTGKRVYQYFLKLLQLAAGQNNSDPIQSLVKYEQTQSIKNSHKIRISPIRLNNEKVQYFIIIQALKKKEIQISNLNYFLKKDSNPNIIQPDYAVHEERKKEMELSMRDIVKNKLDFIFCSSKALCPCCSQVCFEQYNHNVHGAKQHQTRGWGETVVTLGNLNNNQKSFLSTLLCQQIDDYDQMYFNNSKRTWKQFKDQMKDKWTFPAKTKSIPHKQTENRVWNSYGNSFAQKVGRSFRQVSQISQYHLLFIIDQSGSMQGQWVKMGQFYNKIINLLTNTPTDSYKLNRENTKVSLILFSELSRIIYQYQKPNNIGSAFPVMNGGGTQYTHAFKNMESVIYREMIRYSTTVFFLTDGINFDSHHFTPYIPQLNKFITDKNINLVSIYFGSANSQWGQDVSKFKNTFKDIKCKLHTQSKLTEVSDVVQSEIESITPK